MRLARPPRPARSDALRGREKSSTPGDGRETTPHAAAGRGPCRHRRLGRGTSWAHQPAVGRERYCGGASPCPSTGMVAYGHSRLLASPRSSGPGRPASTGPGSGPTLIGRPPRPRARHAETVNRDDGRGGEEGLPKRPNPVDRASWCSGRSRASVQADRPRPSGPAPGHPLLDPLAEAVGQHARNPPLGMASW